MFSNLKKYENVYVMSFQPVEAIKEFSKSYTYEATAKPKFCVLFCVSSVYFDKPSAGSS